MEEEFITLPANSSSIKNRKPIYGLGINDAEYLVKPVVNGVRYYCPYYKVWVDMLSRCYRVKALQHRPTYKDCYVCEEWLIFSNFRSWMETQDWEGKQLDKDILFKENKVYSPETCCFVPKEINVLLNTNKAIRGGTKIGAHSHKASGKFVATISKYNKCIHLGTFETEDEAFKVYKKAKETHVREVAIIEFAKGYISRNVLKALLTWEVECHI